MKRIVILTCLFILFAYLPLYSQESDNASVNGRVTTLAGVTLKGIEVEFFLLDGVFGNSKKEQLIKTVTTDNDGNYKVIGLPYGQYRVSFSDGFDHTEVWRFYLWRKANRVLDIGIPLGITHGLSQIIVSGIIKDSSGKKLSDVTVTLVNAYNPIETNQVRTNANGKYEIPLIQPGHYILYAAKPGYSVNSSSIDLGNGAEVKKDFILSIIEPVSAKK